MYAGGVFVLLLAAELLRDVRFGRQALLVCGAIALAAVATNSSSFATAAAAGKPDRPDQGRPGRDRDLVAHDRPQLRPHPRSGGDDLADRVQAGKYLETERENGSPAYTRPSSRAHPPAAGGRPTSCSARRCRSRPAPPPACASRPAASRETVLRRRPGRAGDLTRCRLGSKSSRAPMPPSACAASRPRATRCRTEGAPGDSTTLLSILRDPVAQPWYLRRMRCRPKGSAGRPIHSPACGLAEAVIRRLSC